MKSCERNRGGNLQVWDTLSPRGPVHVQVETVSWPLCGQVRGSRERVWLGYDQRECCGPECPSRGLWKDHTGPSSAICVHTIHGLCARPRPGVGGCGNGQGLSKGEQIDAIYSELAIARESATIICVLAETQRQIEEWESFI